MVSSLILRFFTSICFIAGFLFGAIGLSQLASDLRAQDRLGILKAKAWEITNQLTPDQLVGQVIHIAIPGKTVDEIAKDEIRKTYPGGIILFGKNLGKKPEIVSLTNDLQKEASQLGLPPFLISTDQEGGRVFRVRDGIIEYPGAMAVGQTGNPEWGRTVGFMTSYDLRKMGINFLFAPILDINNNPFNPVINTRSFGSDAKRVMSVALPYEEGARAGGALPVIKHFPGHGDTNVDSHLGLPIIQKTLEDLESLEMVPFKKAIENGADAVMTAHIVYPKIDEKYPATLSKIFINDILRTKLKFQGIVITDAMEMNAISKNYANDKPGVLALRAGANIVLLTSWGETAKKFREQLKDAYANGELTETKEDGTKIDLLKQAVFLQILKKLELGLYPPGTINSPLVLEFWANREKKREEQYLAYSGQNGYLKEITLDSIRSFPEPLPGLGVDLGQSVSFCRQLALKKSLELGGIPSFPASQLKKQLARNEIKHYVFESSGEKDIQLIAKLAKAHPKKNFVLLHGGTPFYPLPLLPNLQYVLSFSFTNESWSALGTKVSGKQTIPKVDLTLVPENAKAPEKGAFPERL